MRYLRLGEKLEGLRDRKILVCLDFDGTLVPFRRDPDTVFLSREKKDLLKKIAAQDRRLVAVISGRGLKDIEKRVGVPGLIYAGDHGFSIQYGKKIFRPCFSPDLRRTINLFYSSVRRLLKGVPGVLVEDKGMTLTIHYRCAKKGKAGLIKEMVMFLADEPGFRKKLLTRQGAMSLEVRPRVPWDKGAAVAWLLLKIAKDKGPFLPVYIGDDATDEDAFRALRTTGITIRVGKGSGSCARYYVSGTAEVFRFLKRL